MLLGPDQLANYISILKNGLWPGGQLKPKEPPRTPLQRSFTKQSANQKLSALMPGKAGIFLRIALSLWNTSLLVFSSPSDVAANLIGRTNAKQGARRLFAVLQNRRLNRVRPFISLGRHSSLMLTSSLPIASHLLDRG